jgi:hypothetical protein
MKLAKGRRYKFEEYHKKENDILYKLCSICGTWFPCTSEYFYSNTKNKSDGLTPYCKSCAKKKVYVEHIEHHDRFLKNQAKQNQRPFVINFKRELSKKQRENGYLSEWQKNNPDKMKKYRDDKKENRTHKITIKEWESCKEYFNYTCAYCGITEEEHEQLYNQGLHKEHVVHSGSNQLDNCVPSCRRCNGLKFKWSLDEWYNIDNPQFSEEKLRKILKWINEDNFIITQSTKESKK